MDPVLPSSTVLRHHENFDDAEAVLEHYQRDGYHANWCTTYRVGGSRYVDMILTNDSSVDTVCVIEVGNRSLSRVLSRQERKGYRVWHVNGYTRGRSVLRPMFSLLLHQLPSHLEHVYYVDEREEEYLQHLEINTRLNFTLLSHSFVFLDDHLFASSAYVRDRRLGLGVAVETTPRPLRWTSYYNLTFFEFTTILASSANQSLFPSSISTHRGHYSDDSRFAVVLREDVAKQGTWFMWGLNKTEADTLLQTSQASFKPVLSLGYSYNNREEFYLQFVRKENDDL